MSTLNRLKRTNWVRDLSLLGYVSRFSVIGVLATLTYLVVANVLITLDVSTPGVASIHAYLVGMIVSFAGQSQFTFRVERSRLRHFHRFIVMSALGLPISYCAVRYPVISPFWGTILAAATIPIISFMVMKFWVFND